MWYFLRLRKQKGGVSDNMISDIALKICYLKGKKQIRTKAQFWKDFSTEKTINSFVSNEEFEQKKDMIKADLYAQKLDGVICAFDKGFPKTSEDIKKSERPYLLFYRGNIDLLKDPNNNVAVIGVLNPTQSIVDREKKVVSSLIQKNITIVSGLAKGCDEVAHVECLNQGGKTIAILPSTINNILPASNRQLAESIVNNGGLLITEYIDEPSNRYDATSRYIERDRLQAMFAKAVILIASYEQGKGDSGSRHAMKYAESYGIQRFAMFDENTDMFDERFELNKNLILAKKARILHKSSIDEIGGNKTIAQDEIFEQMRLI